MELKIKHSQQTKKHKLWHSILSDIYDYTDQATYSIWHTITKYSHPLCCWHLDSETDDKITDVIFRTDERRVWMYKDLYFSYFCNE